MTTDGSGVDILGRTDADERRRRRSLVDGHRVGPDGRRLLLGIAGRGGHDGLPGGQARVVVAIIVLELLDQQIRELKSETRQHVHVEDLLVQDVAVAGGGGSAAGPVLLEEARQALDHQAEHLSRL